MLSVKDYFLFTPWKCSKWQLMQQCCFFMRIGLETYGYIAVIQLFHMTSLLIHNLFWFVIWCILLYSFIYTDQSYNTHSEQIQPIWYTFHTFNGILFLWFSYYNSFLCLSLLSALYYHLCFFGHHFSDSLISALMSSTKLDVKL